MAEGALHKTSTVHGLVVLYTNGKENIPFVCTFVQKNNKIKKINRLRLMREVAAAVTRE